MLMSAEEIAENKHRREIIRRKRLICEVRDGGVYAGDVKIRSANSSDQHGRLIAREQCLELGLADVYEWKGFYTGTAR
jgi:hypothetical protein